MFAATPGSNALEAVGVEGKVPLESQQQVEEARKDEREENHAACVGLPVLLTGAAEEAKKAALARAEAAPAEVFVAVDARHVRAEGPRNGDEHRDEDENLDDSDRCHLELLAAEERVTEVEEDEGRHDEPEHVTCGHQTWSSAQMSAPMAARHPTMMITESRSSISVRPELHESEPPRAAAPAPRSWRVQRAAPVGEQAQSQDDSAWSDGLVQIREALGELGELVGAFDDRATAERARADSGMSRVADGAEQ